MSAFEFISPTAHAVQRIDSTIFTAPSLVHFAALNYLNGTLSSDIQAISNALTGIEAVSDVSDVPSHPAPLNRCSPHTIVLWTELFGNLVPALPVPTPPPSPTESIITAELESGSEILLFDDGGALVYHMPEPTSTCPPEPAPYLARSMAMIPMTSFFKSSGSLGRTDVTHPAHQKSFIPMTPIMERFEPTDPQDDLPNSEGSQAAIFLQESEDGDALELVVPLAADTSHSVLSKAPNIDSEGSHLETACGTAELGLPIPGGDHIDSLNLRRVLGNDCPEVQPRTMLGKWRIFSFRPRP